MNLDKIDGDVVAKVRKLLMDNKFNLATVRTLVEVGGMDPLIVDAVDTDWRDKVMDLKAMYGDNCRSKAIPEGWKLGLTDAIMDHYWKDGGWTNRVSVNNPHLTPPPPPPQPVPDPKPTKTIQPKATSSKKDASSSTKKKDANPPPPVQMPFVGATVGAIKLVPEPEKKHNNHGWLWFLVIVAVGVLFFLLKDCNLNVGHDNLINNGIMIGGVVHKDCNCDDCHAVRSGTVVTENGSKSSGNGATSSGNNSGATKPSNNGNNASNNNGSGTSNTKPVPPTPPDKVNPWKNPNNPPEHIIPRDNGGNGDNPGNNPGGGETNPGTDPGTTPGGGDTNPPPPKDPPVQPPPEQPKPCPCEDKLSGITHEYPMFNIGFTDGVELNFTEIFRELVPSNLADDERFEIVIVYLEPDGTNLGHEVQNYTIIEAEQMDPLTKGKLTKSNHLQKVMKSRIQWFKDVIGEKYCYDRFRIAIFNARVGRIYANGHYSFPF